MIWADAANSMTCNFQSQQVDVHLIDRYSLVARFLNIF